MSSYLDALRAEQYITANEGYRKHTYLDTEGIPTIGIGFNLDEGFTLEECQLILRHRIFKLNNALIDRCPAYMTACQTRKIVLLDMAYNLGVNGLLNFKKMLGAMEKKAWKTAARELLDSKYAIQVGPRATRNAKMMETGEWLD